MAFYICARYRMPIGQPVDDSVVRRARITMTGFGRFDLAFFCHTERWFTVERGLTAAECIKEIEGNDLGVLADVRSAQKPVCAGESLRRLPFRAAIEPHRDPRPLQQS